MRVTLQNSVHLYNKGILKSYSSIFLIRLKHDITDQNIARIDPGVRKLYQEAVILTELANVIKAKICGCPSVYDLRLSEALFVETFTNLILLDNPPF